MACGNFSRFHNSEDGFRVATKMFFNVYRIHTSYKIVDDKHYLDIIKYYIDSKANKKDALQEYSLELIKFILYQIK